ncbi:MAG TPA: type 1 glutamine amidotransferase [Phycisphaerales bacterium]|nr:type 1 glutamine amidotransferase [Phycisphaerales bacterium]
MAIIVFQHWDLGRPGRLGVTLRDHGFKLDIRRLDHGDVVPGDYDGVEAVISLGGPQNVGENHRWMQPEMEYLRGAHARALPVIGVCLGHQMLAAALGGEVAPMAKPEMGFVDVDLNVTGQTDAILAGIAWRSPQFQSHGQEVKTLPPDSVLLGSSAGCKAQVFRAGLRSYGFQYHFEVDGALIEAYVKHDRGDLAKAGTNADEVLRQSRGPRGEMFSRLADRLSLNLASLLIPGRAAVGIA